MAEQADSGGSTNPYQTATDRNTTTGWLADMTPVDVNIHGLSDYVKRLKTIQDNLGSHRDYVMHQISSLPMQAFGQSGLPEAEYSLRLCMENYGEFSQYLTQLKAALATVGLAAQ